MQKPPNDPVPYTIRCRRCGRILGTESDDGATLQVSDNVEIISPAAVRCVKCKFWKKWRPALDKKTGT